MEIQPRKFGDLLNEWFRLLGRNWKSLLLCSLMAHLPLAVVIAIVFWATGSVDSLILYMDPAIETLPPEVILEALTPLMWTFAIWALLQVPVGAFVYLAAARIVAGDTAGASTTTGGASRLAATRFGSGLAWTVLVAIAALLLLGAAGVVGWALISAGGDTFLTVFLTAVAILTALVLIIRFGLSVSFGLPTIAVEASGPVEALTRSHHLVQGRWWVTLGFIVLTGLIVSTASQVASLVFTPLFLVGTMVPETLALTFGLSVLLQAPLLAAMAAAYTLWYFDLRARSETLTTDQLV